MQSKIKLLHITTVPETFNFFKGQIGYIKAQGYEVHALSSPGKLLIQFGERQQIPVYGVHMQRRITPLQDISAILQIWEYLQAIRPQIVHAHTPKGGLLGMISARLAGIPVRIYHIRGLPMMTATGYKRLLLTWSEKLSCLFAHQVFCVSHSLREVAIKEGLCPPEKIKVLLGGSSNGVDASNKFNPANLEPCTRQQTREKYGIPNDAIVVGFVGRIVRDKGIEELAKAWQILQQEFSNAHLLIVGCFEPQDPVAAHIQEVLTNDPRIHMTGMIDDTPPLYAAMDILTLPTYREGFPNVALEAAAMTLPVVATSIPGCIDAVQNEVTGTLVPPRDTWALATAIRKYLLDSELRYQHGVSGRRRVLQDFRQEAIWNALNQEYLQILEAKGLFASEPVLNV
ncbi:glycosyltransferase [Scytonema sp. UIC 10036]|uniref:glycosyltransferase family 4 protein n=1 Tax=Scytonema sp. UIC 10036 TaxID=2304196 RepID=UPI0012DA7C95|nr:glycosyltransferase family 4 protein [Scytonema sp. UIC 10036]MUG92461.1 glycosyltransferase [Scytonema sp. UIC 10036]